MPTANQVLTALISARATLDNPATWIKGDYAKTADGERVFGDDDRAVCWCSIGAIEKAIGATGYVGMEYRRPLTEANGGYSVAEYNDRAGTTHADILVMFDKGIEIARQQVAAL